MKKLFINILLVILGITTHSQVLNNSVKLKDLAVPNSPAFIIADITPSLTESPNTPKEFALGIAQSFQNSSSGFPENYTIEFAPYWWFNGSKRSIYELLGLKTTKDANGKTQVIKENPFSGLKFTGLSMAFIHKDLIPDNVDSAQKIFSAGLRTTIIKVHAKSYSKDLAAKIDEWHRAALDELENSPIIEQIARETDPAKKERLKKSLFTSTQTADEVKSINDIINRKPLFSWDIATAYALYGIGDSVWQSGRYSAWTTMSTYIPLVFDEENSYKNYFNLNISVRYTLDNYYKNEKSEIVKNNSLDIGGKAALEFNALSIGIESLYRYNNNVANSQNRTVGIINYKVGDNLYVQGAFGKNFNVPDKLVVFFGIKWGFGSETIKLP